MTSTGAAALPSLAGRTPALRPEALLASLVPPPRFDGARFETYLPDPAQPTQAAALANLSAFAATLPRPEEAHRWWRRERAAKGKPGRYLDGGYGVGKTHLLAALWHVAPEPKAYCTFVELTHVVGALGFAAAVESFTAHRLLAIDEFELDDVGDTVLISTLLRKLVA
ncbi:MAG: cell division protein ZapE, partial [Frankiaceae bacterium]|nr:cell division protein ZapE [Frankiaceae bacterium]